MEGKPIAQFMSFNKNEQSPDGIEKTETKKWLEDVHIQEEREQRDIELQHQHHIRKSSELFQQFMKNKGLINDQSPTGRFNSQEDSQY